MGQRGFTLVEVLASVAILGLGIVAVMRLFSGSIGLAKASSDSTSKVWFAKEKMAEVLLVKDRVEGASTGTSEEFNWVLNVKESDSLPDESRLMELDLIVDGAAGAPVRITALKITPIKSGH